MDREETHSVTDYIKALKREYAGKSKPTEYECPICKDAQFIFVVDEEGNERARSCQCAQMKRAKMILEHSGISEEFAKIGFKGYDTRGMKELEEAKGKAIDYYMKFEEIEKTRNNSMLLCGQVGAGKTHLGIAISNNLMEKCVAVAYMPYRNVITRLKQCITDEATYQYELKKYIQARVLFIDDLLKGRITETDVNIMYEIVNHRYMNNMPMIISTEKSLSELIEFDEAIGSRIIEMCREHIVVFNGGHLNYRLRE